MWLPQGGHKGRPYTVIFSHVLTRRLLVEVNSRDDRQRVLQLKPYQNPILECGAQLVFTLSEGGSERDDSLTRRNAAGIASILQPLIIVSQRVLDGINRGDQAVELRFENFSRYGNFRQKVEAGWAIRR